MKTTLLTALAMVIGFTAFLLWYSPRRIVARARARGVLHPPAETSSVRTITDRSTPMKRMMTFIVAVLALSALMVIGAPASAATGVWAVGHVQSIGWGDPSPSEVGTTGRSLRLEALSLVDPVADMRGHVQDLGWGEWSQSTVGTTGRALRLEAIQISGRWGDVICQAHVQGIGWMPPVRDGEVCGTTGRSLRLEAVRLWIEPREG